MSKHLSSVLVRPHVTEKATVKAEHSVYVFEVAPKATKAAISKAVKELYKVSPIKVSTVTVPAKQVLIRGKRGTKAGFKKAYIYVKKGDKIDIA
jgi:large subunit ribosomal protein L23